MWVDIDDLRAELKIMATEAEKEGADEENNLIFKAMMSGEVTAYKKIERMLESLEWIHKLDGNEYIRILREEGNEE